MKCPYCAEAIKDEAIVCLHCHRDLTFFKPIDKRLQAIDSELKDLTEHVSRISAFLDQQQTGGTKEEPKEETKEGEIAPTGKLKKPTKWRIFLIVLLEFVLLVVLTVSCVLILVDLDANDKSYYDYASEEPQFVVASFNRMAHAAAMAIADSLGKTPPSPAATAQSTPAAIINSGDQPHHNSLCAVDERIIFSCPVENSAKIVSVCASKDLASDRGYLQYRFGLPGKIEFEYPEDRNGTQGRFQYFHYPRSQLDGARTHISFNINGDEYKVVEESYSNTYTEQGVSVTGQDKPQKFSNCGTKAIVDYRDLESVLEVNESAENEEVLRRQPWEESQQNQQQQSIRRSSLVLKGFVAAGFVLPIALGLWMGLRWQGKNLKRYVRVGLLCASVEGGIMAIGWTVIFVQIWGAGGEHYAGKFTFPIVFLAALILIDLFRCVFGFATGGLLGDWIERRRYPQLYGRGFGDLLALKQSNRRENLGRFARVTHGFGSVTSSVAPLVPLMGVIITSVIGYYAAQATNAKIEERTKAVADERAKMAAEERAKVAAEEKQQNKQSVSKSADTAPAQSPQPSR